MHNEDQNATSRRNFLGSLAVGTGALGIAAFTAPLNLSGAATPLASGSPVVHFEIGCKDLEKTTSFYTELFGWTKTPVPYASMLSTNSPGGISGQITSLGHEPHQYITFYIQVDDINATLTKIEAAGGKKLIGPIPLPDKKQFAWFKDPEGNMVALITKG